MAAVNLCISYLALGLLFASTLAAESPVVKLSHEGQLRGKQFIYKNSTVDLFLGVPYAKPPVGDLRFRKPEPYPSWTGVKDVVTQGDECVQLISINGLVSGKEDCLLLDITVPGGVNSTRRKPVMVWIHGGGYETGSKNVYMGAPLAVHSDVIVISINYRLGAVGFISDKPGTGNFGLWDQRAALVWVKENIAQFGGDPEMVTIFGESAGGGSVAAQTMSPHNDGLFKRAIQQSGALYTDWGWYLSANKRYELAKSLKENRGCPLEESVYDCLRGLTTDELYTSLNKENQAYAIWRPGPDNDFFFANISDESYDLSKRYDLLSGFNGQEGLVFVLYLYSQSNYSKSGLPFDGVSIEFAQEILSTLCDTHTPQSKELCIDFLDGTYQISSAPDDQERGVHLSYLLGELSFNLPIVNQLDRHSSSEKSTYAYYYNQVFHGAPSSSLVPEAPAWLKKSASHGEEVVHVFGNAGADEQVVQAYIGDSSNLSFNDKLYITFVNSTDESAQPLSDLIMTIWTNFAKTGDPSQPIPVAIPAWTEFSASSPMFMELNKTSSQLIPTPEEARLEQVNEVLFTARRLQVSADAAPVVCEAKDENEPGLVAEASARHVSSSAALLLFALLATAKLVY